jgi:predicted nucleic acid-binding protein
MSGKVFFDTNILIYAATSSDDRSVRAQAALANGGSISVQVLNEFAQTARRKLNRSWSEIRSTLSAFRVLCAECLPITDHTHDAALQIAQQYEYGLYDSLILASAIEAKCETLLSEDMQHGQVIDGRLTIRNPFA